MKRLLLVLALMLATAGSARAACTGPPYVFSNGTPADANQVNTDFDTLYACLNSILPSGLSTPTTVAQATFPGIVPYQFPAAVYATGAVQAGSAYSSASVLAGDLSASRSGTVGYLWLATATLDYGGTNSGYLTASAPLWAPYLRATNAVYTSVLAAPSTAASPQPSPNPAASATITLEGGSTPANNATLDAAGNFSAKTFVGSGAGLTSIPLSALTVQPDILYDASGTAHAGHTVYTQTATTIANGAYSGSVTVTLAGAAQYTSATTYSPVCSDVPVTGFSGNVAVVIAVPSNGTGFQVYLFSTGSAASSTQNVNVYCTVAGY